MQYQLMLLFTKKKQPFWVAYVNYCLYHYHVSVIKTTKTNLGRKFYFFVFFMLSTSFLNLNIIKLSN